MDLTNLVKILRQQAEKNNIIFNEDFLSAEQISALQKGFGISAEKFFTINTITSKDIPDPVNQQAIINAGTVSILSQENLTLQVKFSLDHKQELQFIISVNLPENWQFKDSFENLTIFPFNKTTLSSSYAIYSTLEEKYYTKEERIIHPWADKPDESIILVQGLNIASWLQLEILSGLSGALALLKKIFTSDKYKFYGPITISESTPYPVINLISPLLEKTFEISEKIIVGDLYLIIDVSETRQLLQNSSLRLSASTQDLNFGIEILSNNEYLSFFAEPIKDHTFGISQIVNLLPGGGDFQDYIPDDLNEFFNTVALQSFVLTKGAGGNIGMIGLIIGRNPEKPPWAIIEKIITLDNLCLNLTKFMPGTETSLTIISFSAKAEIFVEIFPGSFDFYVEVNKSSSNSWCISNITGSYYGSVTLHKLVERIVGSTTLLPPALNDIIFSDFGLTVTEEAKKQYSYAIHGQADTALPVMDTTLIATLNVSAKYSPDGYSVELGGRFLVGSQDFELKLDLGKSNVKPTDTDSSIIMSARWQALDEQNYLQFEDIAQAVGFSGNQIPTIPKELNLSLKEADFYYDFSKNQLLICCKSKNYGSAIFAAVKNPTKKQNESENKEEGKENEGWHFFFGVEVDQTINLTNMPLIKSVVREEDKVEIKKIQIVAASATFDKDQVEAINSLIDKYDSNKEYPRIPDANMHETIALSMNFCAGSYQTPLNISISKESKPGPSPSVLSPSTSGPSDINLSILSPLPEFTDRSTLLSARVFANEPPTPASDGTNWINIQKTFGPISFQKVGVRYKESVLYVLMNASLGAGGLTISVMGLGVGSPLKKFEPKFNIDGLAISFKQGSLDISGGMIGTIEPVNFYGELIISAPGLTISALGAYAELQSHPSFFLYAVLNYPIGGPSFFFITGLAAGFGFNRKLKVPDITGVAQFPLVVWAYGTSSSTPSMIPGSGGDLGKQVTDVLTGLSNSGIVAPVLGEYWLALGIRFTSFKLLDSFALLTASFGTNFEIDLLGISTLSLPPAPAPPVAVAQLALKASFSPDKGLLTVEGQLTSSSYIFSRDCHLTGGFAFYLWFSGEHSGDFVVSLGGYSPRFPPPAHYPQVPRLGINWNVSSELTVKGNLYFALTSSAVMAGGGLSAVWTSGDIRAWFDIEIDFLMVFTPFHYYLSARVALGASFRIDLLFTSITITIHLGVGMEIWGPEFAGIATVDLSIVSFTIRFGAQDHKVEPTISWSDFIKQLMPHESSSQKSLKVRNRRVALCREAIDESAQPSIVQICISGGLIKTVYDKQDEKKVKFYVVNAEKFELTTQTTIPAKEFKTSKNIVHPDLQCHTDFGPGPTGKPHSSFTSTHSIEIVTEESTQFLAVPVLGNVPKALWETRIIDQHGVPTGIDPVNNTTIHDVLVGYKVIPDEGKFSKTLHIPIENLLYTKDPNKEHFQWSNPSYSKEDNFNKETVSSTISRQEVQNNRDKMISAIRKNFKVPTEIDVSDLADQSRNYLLAEPVLRLLGEQKVQGV